MATGKAPTVTVWLKPHKMRELLERYGALGLYTLYDIIYTFLSPKVQTKGFASECAAQFLSCAMNVHTVNTEELCAVVHKGRTFAGDLVF